MKKRLFMFSPAILVIAIGAAAFNMTAFPYSVLGVGAVYTVGLTILIWKFVLQV